MLLSQYNLDGNTVVVGRFDGGSYHLTKADSVYGLAMQAADAGVPLEDLIRNDAGAELVDPETFLAQATPLAPIAHPDAAHLHMTGTGLTHLGSASTRSSMHADATQSDAELTDSMKMFRKGLENGKPAAGVGAQPEWFYKGNGHCVVAPEAPLTSPGFHEDGGEEPEIAGIYVVAKDGTPCRVGWAIGNEFSDHVMERENYLYLAHSKLRPAAFGPEILVGELPAHVEGTSRIVRDGAVIWEKPFVSGMDNMSHSFENLEHHHFKYDVFCQPGDVHVHFFGTATLSFADGIRPENGDVFEISAPVLGAPLRNTLKTLDDPGLIRVRSL